MAGILYYTDNQCQERILLAVRKQLLRCVNRHNLLIVSQYPIASENNIVLPLDRSVISMYEQIIKGLEMLTDDIIFFAEHDVIYHPSHFEFVPEREDRYYFNTNIWTVIAKTGQCLFFDGSERQSCMVGFRIPLLKSFKEKLDSAKKYYKKTGRGFGRKMGYEPKDLEYKHFKSIHPNLDIKHGNNMTRPRFNLNQYSASARKRIKNFTLTDTVPYWGKMGDNFNNFIRSL